MLHVLYSTACYERCQTRPLVTQRDFSLRSVAKSIKSKKYIKVLVLSALTALTIPSMPMQHRFHPSVLQSLKLLLQGTVVEWIEVASGLARARTKPVYEVC
jgi:hypothetical protein